MGDPRRGQKIKETTEMIREEKRERNQRERKGGNTNDEIFPGTALYSYTLPDIINIYLFF